MSNAPTILDMQVSAVTGAEVAAKVRLYEVCAKKLVAVDLLTSEE